MSGPRFTPHLRSKSHDTWSSRFGLLFSYPGDVRFLLPRPGSAPSRTAVGGDLGLEKDVFKQAFSYEHENHYL